MEFKKFNANPEGKNTSDCLVRAISSALNIDWEESMMRLAKSACKYHFMLNSRDHSKKFIYDLGWIKNHGKGKKVGSLKTDVDTLVLCHSGKKSHAVFIKDGKTLMDTWDSRKYI